MADRYWNVDPSSWHRIYRYFQLIYGVRSRKCSPWSGNRDGLSNTDLLPLTEPDLYVRKSGEREMLWQGNATVQKKSFVI